MHAALIDGALGGRIIGAIARDATEIEARRNLSRKTRKTIRRKTNADDREKAKNDQENVQNPKAAVSLSMPTFTQPVLAARS